MTKEPFRPQSKNLPTKNLPIQAHPNLKAEIRRRAYEIYEGRGREHGHELDDWVRAEAEITGGPLQNFSA